MQINKVLKYTILICFVIFISGCIDEGNATDVQSRNTEPQIKNSTFLATLNTIGENTITTTDEQIKYQLIIENTGNSQITGLHIMPYRYFDTEQTTIDAGQTFIYNGTYTLDDNFEFDYSNPYTKTKYKIPCKITTENAGETQIELVGKTNIQTPLSYTVDIPEYCTLTMKNSQTAKNVTNKEVWDFLRSNHVNNNNDLNSANQVHNAAERAGIRSGVINVEFYDTKEHETFYETMNVFDTTTNGRIFTSSVILYDQQYDFPAQIEKNEEYEFHHTITDYTDEYYIMYNSIEGIVVKDYKIYW